MKTILPYVLNRSRALPADVAVDIRSALANVPDVFDAFDAFARDRKDTAAWESYLDSLQTLEDSIALVGECYFDPEFTAFGAGASNLYHKVKGLADDVKFLRGQAPDAEWLASRNGNVLRKVADVLEGMALAFEASSAITARLADALTPDA